MIVMDTNVVCELMRLTPEPAVMKWISGQDSAQLYLTAVTEAELRAGEDRASASEAGAVRDAGQTMERQQPDMGRTKEAEKTPEPKTAERDLGL